MIDNRPKVLLDKKDYGKLPNCPFTVDFKNLPSLLKFDMMSLFGIQPIIEPILRIKPSLTAKPSQEEIDYYRKINASFQIIHVVVNLHSFVTKDDIAFGQPYSISIVPGPKRGKPDIANIDLLSHLDLEFISNQRSVYTDFNPFEGVYDGFWGQADLLLSRNMKVFIDSVGIVAETYFLNTCHNPAEILLPGVEIQNEKISKRYRKLRTNKYYKPFTNIEPRRVWGADSPIELFLIQGLAAHNVFPVIQTSIFKDGSIYPNFYEVARSNVEISGTDLITDADLFFPDQKIAVFCDSNKHHRSNKAMGKDVRIVEELEKLDIKCIRISGNDIIDNLTSVVDSILVKLS